MIQSLNKEADKYFGINTNDKSLRPIYVSLPSPPDLKLIDGYGLDVNDQFFRRHAIPNKLINLEARVFRELKSDLDQNSKKTITGAKILNKFWEILEENHESYSEEIKYIKKVIWHTIHGYWFFCYGKPTYIAPWHYELLNFWYNPDISGGYFEYRDRDRRKILFDYYAYTATETFQDFDEEGFAVKVDGKYRIIDLDRRIAYGTIKPKNRRSGETHQGLLECWAIIRKTTGGCSTIISKTGTDTVKYWDEKFIPAWQAYPMFLKPMWNGTNNPNSLELKAPDNDYFTQSLNSQFYPTESADEIALDGGKFYSILLDEQAKVPAKSIKVDILKRYEVNKLTLSQGLNIHGFCTNPSTVEEMNEGGDAYQELCNQSNFYQRQPSGQTKSGLFLQYEAAQVGWEGFISPWGESVIDNPSKELIEATKEFCKKHNIPKQKYTYLYGKGSYRTLVDELDALLKEKTQKAKAKYRVVKRKQPMCYDDCWSSGSGDLGLNIELVSERMAELRRERRRKERKGTFEWVDGPDSEVMWVDNEDGPWTRTEDVPDNLKNQRMMTYIENYETGDQVKAFAPVYPAYYTLGADPFGFHDELVEARGTSKSKGGAGLLKEATDNDKNKPIEDYEGFTFIASYLNDTTQFDFDEQMLMCCVYSGALLFVERNQESTWKHFINRGYRGYLKYEFDHTKGAYASRPGYHLNDKSELFKLLEFYIEKRIHKDSLFDFLKDIETIKHLKQLTKFDRLAGHLAALKGSSSKQGIFMQRISSDSLDIGTVFNL